MLFIDQDIVSKSPVMDMAFSGPVIRKILNDKKSGTAVSAQEVPMFPEKVNGGFYSLPSYLDRYGTAGIKWTSHVKPGQGSERYIGPYTKPVIILSDYEDGRPYALIDGFEISAIRTGAVSYEFFTRYAEDGKVRGKNRILICGAGHQARWQITAALKAFPELEGLSVWSRDLSHAQWCIESVRDILALTGEEDLAGKLEVVTSVSEGAETAGLVIGATSAETPYLTKEHLREASYVHIGMNDVTGEAIRSYDRIYCDDFEAGTWKSAQSLFVLYRQDQTIGERVTLLEDAPASIKEGRVMFDSFGLSMFDIALGCEVYRYACGKGLGGEIGLYSRN